ncbi:hypothetical protein HDV00_012285 [Rhizophlyctis rosea]|nr:hypothetical protein HDV00_012285 [Rhizophlyctis rosea]
MADVYAAADSTIVWLKDVVDQSPWTSTPLSELLPGIYKDEQLPSVPDEVTEIIFQNLSLIRSFADSKWHTRVWTLQEAVLPSKWVAFTRDMTILASNETLNAAMAVLTYYGVRDHSLWYKTGLNWDTIFKVSRTGRIRLWEDREAALPALFGASLTRMATVQDDKVFGLAGCLEVATGREVVRGVATDPYDWLGEALGVSKSVNEHDTNPSKHLLTSPTETVTLYPHIPTQQHTQTQQCPNNHSTSSPPALLPSLLYTSIPAPYQTTAQHSTSFFPPLLTPTQILSFVDRTILPLPAPYALHPTPTGGLCGWAWDIPKNPSPNLSAEFAVRLLGRQRQWGTFCGSSSSPSSFFSVRKKEINMWIVGASDSIQRATHVLPFGKAMVERFCVGEKKEGWVPEWAVGEIMYGLAVVVDKKGIGKRVDLCVVGCGEELGKGKGRWVVVE